MRRCIECHSRIGTDTCDICGRYNDPDPMVLPTVKIGDKIPAGEIGGIKMVLVVTKIIDEYRYEGYLEAVK